MWTKKFWQATVERVIRACASSGVGLLAGTTILDVDFPNAVAVIVTAGIVELLMSLSAQGTGDRESPAVVREDDDNGTVDAPYGS